MENSQPATGTGENDVLSSLAAYVDQKEASSESDEPEAKGQSDLVEEPEQQTDKEMPTTYKVKVNGQELEVPLDELIAGYQKDSDYRQKTAEVAEQRRQADAQRQQAEAEIAQAMRVTSQASLVLQSELAQFNNVNWQQLAYEDPAQYVALKAQYDGKIQQLQQAQWQHEQLAQIENQHKQQQRAEYYASQQQALLDKLPAWKDAAVAKAESESIKSYLKDFGLSEDEINGISDSREVVLARKAMLYDQLMAKQPQAMAKVNQAPQRVEKPGAGTRPADQRTSAMKQLSKTGNVKDAAPLLKAFL